MCFRPAETGAAAVVCPNCDKKVRPAQGQLPKKCPFCKESLEGAQAATPVGAPPTPSSPAAPAAPKAPASM